MELNKQMTTDIHSADYRQWIIELKERIRQSQIKAAVKVNSELLHLYWQMGSDIVAKQKNAQWGDGFLKQLSKDLTVEFPEIKGFSYRNLKSIRQWYLFYNQENIIGKQTVSQFEQTFFSIPWGHHILIMQRCKEMDMALFYIQQTMENNWSRTVLDWQIDSKLYERQGKAISNFSRTLPIPQSDLAQQITKDPYVIDLMGIRQDMEEREIESFLDTHISRFLLELGKGFTFYGRQVQLKVGNDSFYVDLLFYHVRLHCYVVVELKAVKFKPEHVGQLNFYVTAVDNQMRTEGDNPTIGLLICKEKNDVVAEYTLRGIDTPIGISSMQIYEQLTSEFKSALPTIEEIERELSDEE
ncbi:MAG: PDDEXK nuclease domain-containing protein [Prevotella sp.]|nr:PDDEXK nuclease domain-containing protein [Prevotella sp.]